MQKTYQVTSNAFYFGLNCNEAVMLPCVYSKLWRITEDLVGFRQGSLFGIYSMRQEQVVYEPVLQAEMPYFKPVELDRQNKVTEPRYLSEEGTFVKRKAYLETYDYMLWHNNRVHVMGPDGVVVILKNGKVRPYNGRNERLAASRVKQRCLYQGEYGEPNVAELKSFEYMTQMDREIEPENFLRELEGQGLDLNSELTMGDPWEDDDDEDFPVYKHYDYDAIPLAIRQKLLKHLDRLTNNKTYEWLAKALIYMAWCHANSFVTYNEHGEFEIDPMYALPPEEAEHIFDATMLYEAHRMEAVQYLLYLSPLTNSYLDVLVFEN